MIEPTPDFLRAQAYAAQHGLSVCGTFRAGKPIYFVVDPGATEGQVRELAFEAQNGRPMTDDEVRLVTLVESQKPGTFDASLEDLPR